MTTTELEFGPNDWCVQEKYQEYLTDSDSVDPIWREHFGRGVLALLVQPRRAATAPRPRRWSVRRGPPCH